MAHGARAGEPCPLPAALPRRGGRESAAGRREVVRHGAGRGPGLPGRGRRVRGRRGDPLRSALAVDSPELKAELEECGGQKVELRFSERSLVDCRPVSLFGNATATALGEELGMALDRRRFRANLYADWGDGRPFREDELVGRTLQVGDRLRVAVLERDPRCKMITLDPDTAAQEPAVLRHVNAAHGGTVGVYAAVLAEGVVRRGDPILLA